MEPTTWEIGGLGAWKPGSLGGWGAWEPGILGILEAWGGSGSLGALTEVSPPRGLARIY